MSSGDNIVQRAIEVRPSTASMIDDLFTRKEGVIQIPTENIELPTYMKKIGATTRGPAEEATGEGLKASATSEIDSFIGSHSKSGAPKGRPRVRRS